MAEPNPRCGKLDHGEVVGGELLVACGDASEMFDLVKETLGRVFIEAQPFRYARQRD